MRLVLSVGEKVIASTALDPARVKQYDYLNAKKRLLQSKHRLSIAALKEEPQFYIQVLSKANNKP